jgi:GT2 family glycosyltransferase
VLVVIVNYKTAKLTINCLRSLEAEVASIPGARVVVVENASGDAEAIEAGIRENHWESWAELSPADKNGGFAYGNNWAIRPALKLPQPPEYVWLLNSDTEIFPGAVKTLLEYMDAHPEVGITGSSFENPDGSDWPIAFRFITILSELEQGLRVRLVSKLLKNHCVARTMGKEIAQIDWGAGASMMIRRKVFDDIGLLDEGYFLYYEEVDFCLRARRAGWTFWYVPQSRVMHIAGQSTGVTVRDQRPKRLPAYYFESRRRYFVKNFGMFYTLIADLAFGVSNAFWRVGRRILNKPDNDPPHMLGDFWRHSVIFPRNRVRPVEAIR